MQANDAFPVVFAPSVRHMIAVCGGDEQSGSYLLRIRAAEDMVFPYGRFKKAKPVETRAGEYLYVGSALAKKGGVSLARRLVRHATRTGNRPPHPIRRGFLQFFPTVRLGEGNLLPRNGKRLHWNVDHLLDRASVELTGAVIMRHAVGIEAALGKRMERDPRAFVFEKGLGANDIPGNTHLLRIEADDAWWRELPEKVAPLLRGLNPCIETAAADVP